MVRKIRMQHWSYLMIAGVLAACSSSSSGGSPDESDAGAISEADGATSSDASRAIDAGQGSDAHESTDAAIADAGHDGGHEAGHDSGHDADVSDSAIAVDASDAGCSNPGMPTLHLRATPGVFCPFGPVGPIVCGATEECCEPPVASGVASNCQARATTCGTIGSAVWGCEGTLDCAGGKVCCAAGTVAPDPVCGFLRGNAALAASACATSCGGGELHLCASQGECPGGTICTPFKVKGLELGACL